MTRAASLAGRSAGRGLHRPMEVRRGSASSATAPVANVMSLSAQAVVNDEYPQDHPTRPRDESSRQAMTPLDVKHVVTCLITDAHATGRAHCADPRRDKSLERFYEVHAPKIQGRDGTHHRDCARIREHALDHVLPKW
eukprot:CAMPEP_0206062200 /NCGR_PEP_ID=MMETSP1466-20131121/56334_1 /ASSEMBLY_ACC=CAM_ASM_001126 /TAXON_ID=44452 /ORGANISM="Pavlova gyrans, Strain CCMP608" /LENGTH=137 /DNA_ID=CAMNT_0053437559 /DNA_START=207 /DNA_END=616 /DNA_ORIENTATION=-